MSIPGLAPIVTVLVLVELATGTLAVTWIQDLLGEVGRGFLGTTALICAGIVGVALVLVVIIPDPSSLIHAPVDAGGFASAVHWCVALAVLTLLYALLCAVGTDSARRVLGAATVASGVVAVGKAAVVFPSPLLGGLASAVAFLPAALVAGSALAGMLLGHWYLLAPDLTFRPLRQGIYLVFAAVAIQAVAIVLALAAASSQDRGALLGERYGVSFWLLVVAAGLVATALVNGLALYFARIRANQPATAMLYVLIITALMGVIPAHLLYFQTRVPV